MNYDHKIYELLLEINDNLKYLTTLRMEEEVAKADQADRDTQLREMINAESKGLRF
jgi:hypothetical protein